MKKMTNRAIKKIVSSLLSQNDFEQAMEDIHRIPPRQVIGPLFSHFYGDDIVRWRAISAMGGVVSRMADTGDIESARITLRRMMWNLNDESGGIGWGCPEAMGDITARNDMLAKGFHRILVSYIMEEGNYLEHPVLQRGSLWGVGRLIHARPELIPFAGPHLVPFMKSEDPYHRGLSVWAAGPLAQVEILPLIKEVRDDSSEIPIYIDGELKVRTVGDLADEALTYFSV